MKIFGLLFPTVNAKHNEHDVCLQNEVRFEVYSVIRLHQSEPDGLTYCRYLDQISLGIAQKNNYNYIPQIFLENTCLNNSCKATIPGCGLHRDSISCFVLIFQCSSFFVLQRGC